MIISPEVVIFYVPYQYMVTQMRKPSMSIQQRDYIVSSDYLPKIEFSSIQSVLLQNEERPTESSTAITKNDIFHSLRFQSKYVAFQNIMGA